MTKPPPGEVGEGYGSVVLAGTGTPVWAPGSNVQVKLGGLLLGRGHIKSTTSSSTSPDVNKAMA